MVYVYMYIWWWSLRNSDGLIPNDLLQMDELPSVDDGDGVSELVGGLEHHPFSDEIIFFRGMAQPPTSYNVGPPG